MNKRNNITVDKKKLIEISKKYKLEEDIAVISEPYIPYIPENWNGVLVLAESQNLSKNNQGYVEKLKKLSSDKRIVRLYENENNIGVYPWDDGSLKLAIESALKIKAKETAVSNAVLWSQRSDTGANKNPGDKIKKRSIKIWDEFLKILDPKLIIVAGKVASNIINKTNWQGKKIALRLPSKNAMSRISGMFNSNDLLERFPEVREIAEKNENWIKNYRSNKVFYACHAVSLLKEHDKKY